MVVVVVDDEVSVLLESQTVRGVAVSVGVGGPVRVVVGIIEHKVSVVLDGGMELVVGRLDSLSLVDGVGVVRAELGSDKVGHCCWFLFDCLLAATRGRGWRRRRRLRE